MEAPCRAATWSLGEDKGLKARVRLMSWWTRRDMTPEELNETPDDKIQELVAHFVLRRDVGGHEVHPISPFLTLEGGDGASINAARKTPAPYVAYTRSTLPAAMTMLELKDLALEAQRQAASAEADCKKERQRSDSQRIHVEAVKSRCKRAAAEAASARKLARSAKQEVSNAEAQAAKRLSEFAKQAQEESVRRQREAAEQLRIEQAKVVRLGSQVAAASHEAGIHARREAEIQKKAELERARAETELRELAAENIILHL
ncbi:hypothetical protein AB1Y20_000955 [Prymnesium parvum]|uniref:Uncharacterized protein n=1 Tax=Prymnesium parvum TaxID=97485 RepID=A0AB34K7D7_PRYPA